MPIFFSMTNHHYSSMGFIPGDKASSHSVCLPCFIEVFGLGREKSGYVGVVFVDGFVMFLFIHHRDIFTGSQGDFSESYKSRNFIFRLWYSSCRKPVSSVSLHLFIFNCEIGKHICLSYYSIIEFYIV